MENYKNLSMGCLEKKSEIMGNKEKYAGMFSEGRKSLEKLLLTCYEHDIMSQACCSGHLLDDNFFEESYLYLKLKKRNLYTFSKIIRMYKETDFKKICDLEECIQSDSLFKDYFGFCIRCDFDDADEVYSKLTDIINNGEQDKSICLEYEVLELLKEELLSFRKRVLPRYSKGKYEANGITLAQNRGSDIYYEAGNYLDIIRRTLLYPNDFTTFDKPINIETLTRHITDHSDVNYTELIGRYKYDGCEQLSELKKVLLLKK